MAYYRTCPICKATLDPGERCDCEERKGDRMDTQPLAKDIQMLRKESTKGSSNETETVIT